jgi:thiamine transporter ThiT
MHSSTALNFKERHLLLTLTALSLVAFVGHFAFPLTPDRVQIFLTSLGLHAHVGANSFADTRAWLGIHNALDVLSNLPFAVFGGWGLIKLKSSNINPTQRVLLQTFFVGLLLTTLGSIAYHLNPNNDTLLWDRAGMTLAFAGVLGVAASERVSERAGIWLALITVLAAALALWVWQNTGDVLAWSAVQFGGMGLVIWLACAKRLAGSFGVSLWALIVFYAMAKVLESTDHSVFEATGHWLSGHSSKHLVASFAALPVLSALHFLKK